MSAEFNLGESYRFKARDNGMTSRPLSRPEPPPPDEAKKDHTMESLRDQVVHSFDHLAAPRSKGGAGVRVKQVAQSPYGNAEELLTDIRKNGMLQVDDSWGIPFPSEMGAQQSENPVGHPIEKIDRPLTDATAEMQKGMDISPDPAKQAQQSNVTNRYRKNFSSRTR